MGALAPAHLHIEARRLARPKLRLAQRLVLQQALVGIAGDQQELLLVALRGTSTAQHISQPSVLGVL